MRAVLFGVAIFGVLSSAAAVRITAEFDPKTQELRGTQWVEFSEPQDEAWFLLLANLGREKNPYVSPLVLDSVYVWGFDPAWTKIEEVVWEPLGMVLPFEPLPAPATYQTYSLADVFLRVELPKKPGTLRLAFRTRFPHVWTEPGRLGDIYTWRFGWHPIPLPTAPGETLPLFLPFHHYEVELVLPEGWRAFLPGQAVAEGNRFRTRFPVPVNSVALYFGPAERFHAFSLQAEGRVWEGVAMPGDEAGLRAILTWAPEILAWYEERFGPYPLRRILLVEHPTDLGLALTAEGIVFLPRWFFAREHLTATGALTRLGLFVLAHELAHLWWGVGVGVDFDTENWLSEGFSQYLSVTWFEERFGHKGGNLFVFDKKGLGEELLSYQLGFVNLREHLVELPYLELAFLGFDEALVKPTREIRYDQVTADRIYNKGYLVLRALAHVVGEEVFARALRRAVQEFRGQEFTVAMWQRILEEESGQNLTQFFADWVRGEAWADYGIAGFRHRPGENGYEIELLLTYRGTGVLAVPVELRGPEEQKKTMVWRPAQEERQTLTITLEFPVMEVVLDPEHRVLDVDRLNNRWPRRYVWAMKREFPLDGYVVSTDPSGAFSLSYLNRFGFAVYPQELAVAGWVRFGREASVRGWAQVQESLVGSVTISKNLWATPHIGSTATYWEQRGELSLTLARLPQWALGLGLSWSPGMTRAAAGAANVILTGEGHVLSFNHTELFGLGPHFYPTLTLSLGFASAGLDERFWPALTELRSLRLGADGPPQARTKTAAILGLWLPPYLPAFSLGQAALVSEIRPRLFLAAGQLWNDTEKRSTFLEVGGELLCTVEALGGFLRLHWVLGWAWPLIPQGPALLYFGLVG